MFIRATREFLDDMGKVVAGQVVEVDDFKGGELIRLGLADNAQEASPHGIEGPTSSGPNTAPTGAEGPSSSSPEAQAQSTPIANPPAVERTSFASTTDTGSAPAQTLFTDATAHGGRRTRERKSSRG